MAENANPNLCITKEDVDRILAKVTAAQKVYSKFTQEQVDKVFEAAAMAACMQRIPLAQMAVDDTQMGVMEDKVIKNQFASEFFYNKYRHEKTCGLVQEDTANGYRVYAEPLGVIAGIIPTTNPTSTAIFKALSALKTRNGIVFSPHPTAKRCTIAAAKVCLDAAVKAGAPADIISWIEAGPGSKPLELSQHLMGHKQVQLILATGGPSMVRAAHSSGNPAIGVGPGNVPAIIDETAHVPTAVASIIMSKTFDNGMICASEQTAIVHANVYDDVKREFRKRGCHFVTADEKKVLDPLLIINGLPNAKLVGKSALRIIKTAGLEATIPEQTPVLLAEIDHVGHDEHWSLEKLCPTLGLLKVASFEEGVAAALKCVQIGGMGHTCSLFTHPQNQDRIKALSDVMPTGRILINSPGAHGGIGDIYNFVLAPSLTLGCGSWGGNTISENVAPKHLLNYKTVAERRENMLWLQLPPRLYFKYGCLPLALTSELRGKSRCFIVTDKPLFELGFTRRVADCLHKIGLVTETFYDVEPDPSFDTVYKGLDRMKLFKPDCLVALGGGSPIDAAKIMWLFYEYPEYEGKIEYLCARFMDVRKRIYSLPKNLSRKCTMVVVPTTSGTGSEVTPFAVITNRKDGIKYPIADYALMPDIAVSDPELCLTMPKGMVAATGLDVLTHAIEAYVSVFSTPFTSGYSLTAIDSVFKYLERSYVNGKKDQEAKEAVHYAATLAGISFANAFLGICHSCAHKLGAKFHIPHGIANALMLPYVIYYNSTAAPSKIVPFPQYTYPQAKERFAEIAHMLHLGEGTLDEQVMKLIYAIDDLKARLGVPLSLQDYGVPEEAFLDAVDDLALQAFDDQCTGSNPRYPLVSELKGVFLDAYYGTLKRGNKKNAAISHALSKVYEEEEKKK